MIRAPLVLVLEDEELISWDLEVSLAEVGYLVATARSCPQAADLLATRRPDVAVLDVLLSDGQCVDVAKKLHADDVPFVVHSALARTEVDDAFRSGTFLASGGSRYRRCGHEIDRRGPTREQFKQAIIS
ncbi:response regulator [Mesorhizobium sp. 2RAF45]|uniref:response regulator n=1 Tax=Mesorhizobium sp. 2RAF45 TaxID=3233001 RepID=UPI003F962728